MDGQLNGMCLKKVRDSKLDQLNHIMDCWEVHGCACQEVDINLTALPGSKWMTLWFWFDPWDIRTTRSHNTHEHISLPQQGGTTIILGMELCYYATEVEDDFRRLGRWFSLQIHCAPTHISRLISVYNQGYTKPKYLGTTYQQHIQYFQTNNLNSTPRDLFKDNFLLQIGK